MIDIEKFNFIKEKYGHCASWAIWKEVGATPKSNMGDLNVLDPQQNPDVLSELKPDVVFVGLNISIDIGDQEPFSNFHPTSPHAQDYKTRFALKDTELWGGYMTDIIKNHVGMNAQEVMNYLSANPDVEDKNIETFRKELKDIGTENPTIIAFGIDAHSVLTRNLNNEFNIFQVTHYSYQGLTKEDFRNEIKSLIERIQINSEIRKDKSEVLKSYKEKNVISEEKTLDVSNVIFKVRHTFTTHFRCFNCFINNLFKKINIHVTHKIIIGSKTFINLKTHYTSKITC